MSCIEKKWGIARLILPHFAIIIMLLDIVITVEAALGQIKIDSINRMIKITGYFYQVIINKRLNCDNI